MNFLNITRTSLVLILFVFSLGAPARAEDPRFLSAYHSEYGLKLLNDGRNDQAVERFVQAFLLDPQNKTAKESLQKIASEQPRESSRGLKILRFIDQVEYLVFLTARYEGLTQENGRLLEFLRANKNLANNQNLLEKFHAVEGQVNGKPSALPQVGLIGFSGGERKNFDLDGITNELAQERENLAKEVGFWEEQNNALRSVRKDVLMEGSAEVASAAPAKYKSQLEEVNQRVTEKDQLLSVQQQNIEYFKTELSAVRESFNALQEKFKSTDVKIADLTSRIASMSVELFEKNKLIGEKDERAANLEKDLNVANEKMSLVQRIIQEKDDRISALEKEMAQLQVAMSSPGKPSDQQVVKLQSDFKNFEEQFKTQLDKSRERIVSLETQYTDLTTKYEALLAETQAKDAQVAVLKTAVTQKDALANQYRQAFLTIDQKTNQLLGMIEIYRGKLADVKKNLSSKEEELRKLQGALFDVKPAAAVQSKAREQNESPKESEGVQSNYDLTFSKSSSNNPVLQAR